MIYNLFRGYLPKFFLFSLAIFNTLSILSLTIPSANENYSRQRRIINVQAIKYLLLFKKKKHFHKCMSCENNELLLLRTYEELFEVTQNKK